MNLALAPLWLLPLLAMACWWAWRVARVRRAHLAWSSEQVTAAQGTAVALVLQTINAATWLTSSAISLAVRCSWFDRCV